jgi:hypothetical protein
MSESDYERMARIIANTPSPAQAPSKECASMEAWQERMDEQFNNWWRALNKPANPHDAFVAGYAAALLTVGAAPEPETDEGWRALFQRTVSGPAGLAAQLQAERDRRIAAENALARASQPPGVKCGCGAVLKAADEPHLCNQARDDHWRPDDPTSEPA